MQARTNTNYTRSSAVMAAWSIAIITSLSGCGNSPSPRDAATDASTTDAADGGSRRDAALPRDASTTDARAVGGDAASNDPDAGPTTDAGDAGGPGNPEMLTIGCHAPKPSANPLRACPNRKPVPLKSTVELELHHGTAVFLTHAPNDPERRSFVAFQDGLIMVVRPNYAATTFLNLADRLTLGHGDGAGEMGLLGMAFDPDYDVTGRFWVNYTRLGPGGLGTQTVVESYRVSSDPNVADPTTRTPLLAFDQPEENHNGGMLAFGPDGCLYVGTGDGGGFSNDAHASAPCLDGNGQCLNTELGKILRVDVDHPAVAPAGNLAGAGIPHIWDYGLRNPWRFSFDRLHGDLYIADVGQDQWEEIDIEPKGTGGNNYGWRVMEGKHPNANVPEAQEDAGTDGTSSFAAPVHDYPHEHGNGCIIGGYVYRGSKIPTLRGYYVYGDFMSGRTWALAWNGADLCGPPIELTAQLGEQNGLTSFGEDVDGELYMLNTSGRVTRIEAM